MNEERRELLNRFGKRLKNIRLVKYENLNKLSEITGIARGTLYNYEEGKAFPPIDNFIRICEALDKTPSFLLKPFLKISLIDKDFLELFEKMKEFRNDPDAWELIEFMFLGLDIYSMEQRKDTLKDIVTILKGFKNILLRKRA